MYFDRSTEDQQAPIPVWRFQIVASENRGDGQIFVFEPAIGQWWPRNSASHIKDNGMTLARPMKKQELSLVARPSVVRLPSLVPL